MPKKLITAVGIGTAFGAGAGFYAGFFLGFGNALGKLKREMDDRNLSGEGQNGSRPEPSDYPTLPDINLHQS